MAKYVEKTGEDLSVGLNLTYGGKGLNKSLSKLFKETKIEQKIVDANSSFVSLISFNSGSSFLSGTLKNCSGIVICNEGDVPAELLLTTDNWNLSADPDAPAGDIDYIHMVLNAGEFFYFPNIIMFNSGTTNTSAAVNTELDNQVPATAMYVDSGVNLDGALEDSESALQVADIAPFEVGDLVQVGINDTTATRIEVMEITSITDDSGTDQDAAGTLVVKRALYGTSKADKDAQTDSTNGAVSGANVHFPIFNQYYEYNTALSGSSQLVMTDGQGRFKISNFFGYGRSAASYDSAQGIVSGSVAIKFYESAYHEIHFKKPITASTDSKLTASTTYAFDLTLDDSLPPTVTFTASSNTKFGGSDGIIRKMQDAIDTASQTAGNRLFGYSATVSIVNGKLRITSNSHMAAHDGTNGSKVLIADASSGTDLFTGSVGIFPDDADFPAPVEPVLPDDIVINRADNTTYPNDDAFMYDDGHGNLIYQGYKFGRINYLTGACEWAIPSLPYAQFVVNAYYDSALSGGVKILTSVGGNNDTGISFFAGRSMNSKVNAKLGVYAFN